MSQTLRCLQAEGLRKEDKIPSNAQVDGTFSFDAYNVNVIERACKRGLGYSPIGVHRQSPGSAQRVRRRASAEADDDIVIHWA